MAWQKIGNLRGVSGRDGASPTPPSIKVGSVRTGDAPSVTNSGTEANAVFDFVIPKGSPGNKGDAGESIRGKDGQNGKDASSVQLRRTDKSIQWKSDKDWVDLVPIADLMGASARDGEPGPRGEPGQGFRYVGSTTLTQSGLVWSGVRRVEVSIKGVESGHAYIIVAPSDIPTGYAIHDAIATTDNKLSVAISGPDLPEGESITIPIRVFRIG